MYDMPRYVPFIQGFNIIFGVTVSMEKIFVSCTVAYPRLQTCKTTDKLNTSHYNLNTHLSSIFFGPERLKSVSFDKVSTISMLQQYTAFTIVIFRV